jgi:hypothetical protein
MSKKMNLVNLEGWNRHTEFAVDLKTVLHSDRKMKKRKDYQGVLRLDEDAEMGDYYSRDAHCTFTETVPPSPRKRNPYLFVGRYVSVTLKSDGRLRPNLKQMPVGMSVDNYAFEVYRELRGALKGLVEE